MSTTLYRKYRPKTFAEMIGQEFVMTTLQNEILSNSIAHAYLFAGPRGLGKTTTARLLAKAINCAKREANSAEPCNECEYCRAILHNQSLDVIEIDAASHRGINEIRSLKEHIGFTPSGNEYRVFVIDEVHMLTSEAFNALLKTLEEPPQHAVFILATTELHKVPDTIRSRCQTFIFKRINIKQLVDRLNLLATKEGVNIDKEVLELIAQQSSGYVRDAESLLGQVIAIGEKYISLSTAELMLPRSKHEYVYTLLGYLVAGDSKNALLLVQKLVEEGVDLDFFIRQFLEVMRLLLLAKHDAVSMPAEADALVRSLSTEDLITLVTLCEQALQETKRADILQLPLELFIIAYIHRSSKEDLVAFVKNNDTHNEERKDHPTSTIENNSNNEPHTPYLTDNIKKDITQKTSRQPTYANKNKAHECSLNLNIIQQQWKNVVSAVRVKNHSLALALNMVYPQKLIDHVLEMGSSYVFHIERLKQVANKKIVEEILHEIFGCVIDISITRLSEEEMQLLVSKHSGTETIPIPTVQEEGQFVEHVMQTFGGTLVSD